MKIAVCYSGGLRTFKKCYAQNHQTISKLGEIDYYISTWELPCYTKVARYDDTLAINGSTIYDDLLRPDEFVTEEYLSNLLKFKKIDIEPMSKMHEIIKPYEDYPWHIMHPARLISQYYKMNRCNSLVEDEYDIVIRIRPDVTISELPDIDTSKIIINHMVYVDYPSLIDGVNEMIYISTQENMHKICNIYNNFDKLLHPSIAYGERMTYLNFEYEGILDKCEPFDFGLWVIRENGNDERVG
jgi:hypothetical protein